MLKHLFIQNYAIIEMLDLDFQSGFTVLTGETGAGKSIILGALGLIMGRRADTKVLYIPDKNCIVEATFDQIPVPLLALLKEQEIIIDQELIIRREILISGKSRAFVNDSLVNLNTLNEIGSNLIEMHQQFDILDMFQTKHQMHIIDVMAENYPTINQYNHILENYNGINQKLNKLKSSRSKSLQEMDFIRFQLEELEKLNLQAGEQETLEKESAFLSNAEEIKKVTYEVNQILENQDQSIVNVLRQLNQKFSSLTKIDSTFENLYERIDVTIEELKDISTSCEDISENLDFNPKRLEEIDERLSHIYRLQKKHEVLSVDELLEKQNQLNQQFVSVESMDEVIQNLESELKLVSDELTQIANKIYQNRLAVTTEFENKVQKGLANLGMEHSKIQVQITHTDSIQENGFDLLEFYFAPNKGSQYLPLKDIASGGETSRLSLVIKSMIADQLNVPTLIFDEIDLGVSGEIAGKMGRILKSLSRQLQLISISHSAQIAALADHHYFIYKQEHDHRVATNIKILDGPQRILEIAKMLSGDNPSEVAMATAKELLQI